PAVVDELLGAGGASPVFFEGAGRREPRWRAWTAPATPSDERLSSQATYLVTGGLGALGLACAERLVERGARRLVLAQRSGPTVQAEQALARLRDGGAQVVLAAVDLRRRAAIDRLFDQTLAALPALAGIVHAAGVRSAGL